MARDPGDVGRILNEAARLATTGANVRCDLTLPEDLWLAEINATQILNVFNNLLINARQAMPEGGVIQASAKNLEVAEDGAGVDGVDLAPGRYVEVRVRDRGKVRRTGAVRLTRGSFSDTLRTMSSKPRAPSSVPTRRAGRRCSWISQRTQRT